MKSKFKGLLEKEHQIKELCKTRSKGELKRWIQEKSSKKRVEKRAQHEKGFKAP
ncbi:MAG TPA: hypothetical protein PLC84_02925 [Methanosarcina thermophila]|uniref:hypothetical protein n=1 Tax=Methanosarcina thermophila TaxID=2210 RepID=UPI00248FA89F|nr:hypothetical protein [Methanosarcina thermophila]HOQ64555.1 hypothetical protein [Methanosarcina thermophila]HPT79786.1 hypothetical protein [Methanosarcina thermophila]HPZ19254.1 hypothetical protein [Methanosarcina thermophila]